MPMNFSNDKYVYYSNDNSTALKKTKENTVYIWKILVNVFDNDGKTDDLPAEYLQQIMSENLINNTSKADKEIGKKLKALIISLDSKENREKFMKSWFAAAISAFRTGDINGTTSNEKWVDYSPVDPSFNKGALNTALISYKDSATNLCFNMNTFFDTIIEKNNGKYQLKNISAIEGNFLLQETQRLLDTIKQTSKFKSYYKLDEKGEIEQ
jgi:hypothetical protein